MIAAIEQSGRKIDTMTICSHLGIDPSSFGITTDTVSGQQLGMLLRQAVLFDLQIEGVRNWLMEAQAIFDAYIREDWKIAGFKSWPDYIEASKAVTSVNLTQAKNRRSIFKNVKPRLDEIGVNVIQMFMPLKPSVGDDLVALLTDEKTLDNDGLRLICSLVMDGQVTTRAHVDALKSHPAIRVWTKFASALREAGMDPLERALNLGMDKLGPVAQFVTSATFEAKLNDETDEDGGKINGFISQMENLALEHVQRECGTPHSASHDHTQVTETYDDDEEPIAPRQADVPIAGMKEAAVVSIDEDAMERMTSAGASDEHTKLVFKVTRNDATTGYVRVTLDQEIPILLAQKLANEGFADFMQDGKKHIVKRGVLVQAK